MKNCLKTDKTAPDHGPDPDPDPDTLGLVLPLLPDHRAHDVAVVPGRLHDLGATGPDAAL